MFNNFSKKIIFASAFIFLLSACTNVAPYIFVGGEFNRESSDFAKELKDRSSVEICYNKRSTTPKILTQMATDECRRFGKVAHFMKNKNLACTISAPAKAVYWCLCPGETAQSRQEQEKNPFAKKEEQGCSSLR